MIKKLTKVVFEGEADPKTQEMAGGIPLSKGESVRVHKDDGKVIDYKVVEKTVECFMKGKDQEVNITYLLRKK